MGTELRKGDIFVGRQREMAELRAALDDAIDGHGRLVMLAGEPGIGKTRTAQELADVAQDLGALVLWGWCYEGEGAPPYWPWVQLIRSYVQGHEAAQLRSETGPGAADIAEIVPELQEKLPDLPSPPALDPEQARFHLFDSITTFLKNAAQFQPIMLVLDDLHWADRSSLLLLEFWAKEIETSPLLLVGAYRDVEVSGRHQLSQTLGNLVRSLHFRRVQLEGLTRKEVGEFAEASAGVNLPRDAVEVEHQRTEGNPLFVGEVVRLVSPEQMADIRAWTDTIPSGVRDTIGRRLNRLSENCNQVFRTTSVIGREFDFKLLRLLSRDIDEDRLLEVLDEALAVRVLEEVQDVAGRHKFAHALIQETLAEELSANRKVRLQARISEALEELYGENLEAHAAELAHHFAGARSVLGFEKLARYSLMAGERALASSAYEEAITHFERGLVARNIVLSGTEAASDEEAAALLFELARAKSATGVWHQLVESFATLSGAFEYYAKVGNVALAVAAAEFLIAPPASRTPGVAEPMARALTLVPSDSHEAGRLLSRYGAVLGNAEGDCEGARQTLRRAITIARLEGDVALEVRTLSYAALVSGQQLQWQESVDNGLRTVELAFGDENTLSEMLSRYWTAVSLFSVGDLDAARPHALVLRDLAERRSTPRQIASNALTPITFLSCLEGDWKAGRESSDRSLELSPQNPQLLGPRALLEHETGESAEGEVYLERLLDVMRRTGPVQLLASGRTSIAIPTIARITGVPERLEIAEAAAKSVLSAQSVTPLFAIWAKAGRALLAVRKGDRSAAEERHTYLLGRRSTMICTISSVDRLLGLLAQTMGNVAQAATHFEDALAFCRKAGYRTELAWTCCDYADAMLGAHGRAPLRGDRANCMPLLDEGLAISAELGMRPLMERVLAHKERVEDLPVRAPAYPDGLTQREVEVLRLVATGKTDREIAEELFISVATVSTHVRNLLNKTNVSNRTEATAYAARQRLI